MMNERRIRELVGEMKAFDKETYHKSEILPELLKLQSEAVALTFDEGTEGIENLRMWDVKRKLEELNASRNGIAKEEFEKFARVSGKVSNAIRAEISGNRGEYYVFNKLEKLRCSNVVIKNLEIAAEEEKTEIDAIVITRKGIFIIEVKNSKKDIFISEDGGFYRTGEYNSYDCNIGSKMHLREELVKKILRETGVETLNIHSIVVFTNNRITLHNEDRELKVCFLDQLLYNIYNMDRDMIYEENELAEIGAYLEAARCQECYPFEFDINEFKWELASLLVKLESSQEKECQLEVSEEREPRVIRREEIPRKKREKAIIRKLAEGYEFEGVASIVIGILVAGNGIYRIVDSIRKSA